MPKQIKSLTSKEVEALARPGLHAVSGGLYLQVSKPNESKPVGARSWVFRYSLAGRRRELGLGSYPKVKLAEARELVTAHRAALQNGVDPIEAKRAAKPVPVPTFAEAADDYIKAHEAGWRNAKHVAQWRMTLGDAYCKKLRSKRVDVIATGDVLEVLKPVWLKRPETASRVRGRIEAVLDAAKAQGHRSGENPAAWRGNLQHLLPARKKLARGHHPAMPYKDVADFVKRLREREGVTPLALEFTILTAARSGEVLGATWSEIDLHARIWTVPAERMKAKREHRVPLSGAVLAVLERAKAIRQSDDGYVFPGARKGRPMSDMTLTMMLRGMEAGCVTHGFRSSFKDWASECTPFPNQVSEAALAHAVADKVEAAYRRGDLFEKRRKLMDAWALYVEPRAESNVSQLKRA